MLLGDFLNTFAVNSGIPADSPELKAILSNVSVASAEIPDTIVSKIQSNYLTLDAAKNNTVIANHFKAQIYNGVDAELDNSLNELGLEDSIKSELKSEKSSTKRINLALKKIAELEKSKAKAGSGDKQALQEEINKLNNQIVEIKRGFDAEKQKLVSEHQNDLLNYDLDTVLSGYNYSLPEQMPIEIKRQTAKMAVNQALQSKDAKFVRENGALKLIRTSTGADYFDETNNKVDYKKFIETTLAQNSLLAVNKNGNGQLKKETFTVTGDGNGQQQTSKSWDSMMTEAKSLAIEKTK